jgi:transposase
MVLAEREAAVVMGRPRKYPPELLERGARPAFESNRPIAHVARGLGLSPETLRRYVSQEVEADEGLRSDLPTAAEREEIRALSKENYELRRANEILKAASVFLRPSSTKTGRSERVYRRASRTLRGRADCRVLGVSASAYHQRATGQRSPRRLADERLLEAIRRVHAANSYAYDYRRTWKALLRAGEMVGRDHVKRLMCQDWSSRALSVAASRGAPPSPIRGRCEPGSRRPRFHRHTPE